MSVISLHFIPVAMNWMVEVARTNFHSPFDSSFHYRLRDNLSESHGHDCSDNRKEAHDEMGDSETQMVVH